MTFAGGSFIFEPGGRRSSPGPPTSTRRSSPATWTSASSGTSRKRWTFKRDERPEIILHSLERIVRGYED